MDNEEVTIGFGIVRIKDLGFEIDETATVDDTISSQVTFDNTMSFLPEQGNIEFTIDAKFFTDKVENSTFLKGRVQTTFFVVDMMKYVNKDTNALSLPHPALVAMMSIAISHARALIAKASMGSKFNNLYMPLVNPTEVLNSLLSGQHTP